MPHTSHHHLSAHGPDGLHLALGSHYVASADVALHLLLWVAGIGTHTDDAVVGTAGLGRRLWLALLYVSCRCRAGEQCSGKRRENKCDGGDAHSG